MPSVSRTAPSPASSAWSIPPSATSATPSVISNASRLSNRPSTPTSSPNRALPLSQKPPNQRRNQLKPNQLTTPDSSFRHLPLRPLPPLERPPQKPPKSPPKAAPIP